MPIFAGHFERLLRRFANRRVSTLPAGGRAVGNPLTHLINDDRPYVWHASSGVQVLI